MNPNTFPFDFTLWQEYGFPVVCRDGMKISQKHIEKFRGDTGHPWQIIYIRNNRQVAVNEQGLFKGDEEHAFDIFFDLDPSNPAYRKAVEKAHKAGEEIWVRNEAAGLTWSRCRHPLWNWNDGLNYRLAAHVPKQEPDWQPIETAPKDGTEIELSGERGDVFPSVWSPYFQCWMINGTKGAGKGPLNKWRPIQPKPRPPHPTHRLAGSREGVGSRR